MKVVYEHTIGNRSCLSCGHKDSDPEPTYTRFTLMVRNLARRPARNTDLSKK